MKLFCIDLDKSKITFTFAGVKMSKAIKLIESVIKSYITEELVDASKKYVTGLLQRHSDLTKLRNNIEMKIYDLDGDDYDSELKKLRRVKKDIDDVEELAASAPHARMKSGYRDDRELKIYFDKLKSITKRKMKHYRELE